MIARDFGDNQTDGFIPSLTRPDSSAWVPSQNTQWLIINNESTGIIAIVRPLISTQHYLGRKF